MPRATRIKRPNAGDGQATLPAGLALGNMCTSTAPIRVAGRVMALTLVLPPTGRMFAHVEGPVGFVNPSMISDDELLAYHKEVTS